ncbi:MAG: DUF983 domain-containing protein [Candidatus Eisenbacteria bacterium]|nr:DUF983 domain-containing protein [Candidatus Eisenbacteria bacterium]
MNRRLRQGLRALALRCPLCGAPWPRRGRLALAAQCGRCDLFLERREHDAFLGAYTISLFACLAVAVAVVFANLRWLAAPAPLRYAASVAAIAAFALRFYPVGKMLWLAVDVQFRPPAIGDFEDPAE